MHIKRERSRRAALGQCLKRDCMVEKASTRSAPFFRDAQLIKPLLAQPPIIFGRVRRLAVMIGRPSGKIGCQLLAAPLQPLLLLGEPKIHASTSDRPPRSAQPRA